MSRQERLPFVMVLLGMALTLGRNVSMHDLFYGNRYRHQLCAQQRQQ